MDQTTRGSLSEPQLCILSLDGGGVRGLSALLILHDIMSAVGRKLDLAEMPRPCDYFDLIIGTSTGGLIALMLGRLGMSVDACIEAYKKLSKDIFEHRKPLARVTLGTSRILRKTLYSATVLEKVVQGIIAEHAGDPNARMCDTILILSKWIFLLIDKDIGFV